MMSRPPTRPQETILKELQTGAKEHQERRRTLSFNSHALERLTEFALNYMALLIDEADRIARRRRGDDIQGGDVEQAKEILKGKGTGNYWMLAAGSAFLGAGVQGLIDALLSGKGIAFMVLYSTAIVVGTLSLYFGAPRH